MFAGAENPEASAERVVSTLGSQAQTLTHGRHITIEQAQDLDLNIEPLESDANKNIQEAVLSVHHCYNW
jgi:hypothetical protein